MSCLQKTPVFRILFPFSLGGLAGFLRWVEIPAGLILAGSALLWIQGVLLYYFGRLLMEKRIFRYTLPVYHRGLFLLMFTGTGYGAGAIRSPEDPSLVTGEQIGITGMFLEEPVNVPSGYRAEMKISKLVSADTALYGSFRVMAYLKSLGDSRPFHTGMEQKLLGTLYPVRSPVNPGSVDYSSLLHRRGIWYRFYANPVNQGIQGDHGGRGPLYLAASVRESIRSCWKGDPRTVALLGAVCLGERDLLPGELRSSFQQAGGMHLLAVSGLHVGIIWWVLHHVLGGLTRITRREGYRMLVLVGSLWAYAFITGFSSSVIRSVTMCSLFSLGRLLNRRMDPVNGVMVSALLLLIPDPGRILEAGFQLSYAGVLGIVTLVPFLQRKVSPRSRILKWTWNMTAAGLAAQVATLPFVVFYFGKLPLYSLITNLLAVPLLTLIVTLFMVSLPFLALGILTGLFNVLLVLAGRMMTGCMDLIGSLPFALIPGLVMDPVMLYLLTGALISIMSFVRRRSRAPGIFLIGILCASLAWNTLELQRSGRESGMTVAHFDHGSLITFREGRRVDHYMWPGDSLTKGYQKRYVQEAWSIHRYEVHAFWVQDSSIVCGEVSAVVSLGPDLWIAGNPRCFGLVIGRNAGTFPEMVTLRNGPQFILLREEPWLNQRVRVLAGRGTGLIADGTNRWKYIQQADLQEDSIYFTGSRGAYSKRW